MRIVLSTLLSLSIAFLPGARAAAQMVRVQPAPAASMPAAQAAVPPRGLGISVDRSWTRPPAMAPPRRTPGVKTLRRISLRTRPVLRRLYKSASCEGARSAGEKLIAILTGGADMESPEAPADGTEGPRAPEPASLSRPEGRTPPKAPAVLETPAQAKKSPLRQLWFWIFVSLAGGVAFGTALGAHALPAALLPLSTASAAWGKVFVTALRFLAGPLIFSSVLQSIGSNDEPGLLKSLGWKVAAYFFLTSCAACAIGIGVSMLLHPGTYFLAVASGLGHAGAQSAAFPGFWSFVGGLIPASPWSPFIHGNMPQIGVLALACGSLLSFLKNARPPGVRAAARRALRAIALAQKFSLNLIKVLMLTTPLAVFGMTSRMFMGTGIGALLGMGAFVGTVLAGLALLVGFHCLLLKTLARRSPRRFLAASKDAILTGFTTASSTAAMPLAMRTAKESLGVRPAIANLLITLGTVFNMGGTTIYQVSTMVFLAQAFGVHLSLATLLVMILILQTSSVGTPGIPGASMAILATALTTAGIPLKGLSLVLGVDRILDMARTSVNVIGDLSSTVMMDEMSRKRKPDPGN